MASRMGRKGQLVLASMVTLGLAGTAIGCSTQSGGSGQGQQTPIVVGHGWSQAINDDEVAVFGMIMNTTDSEVTVVDASSPLSGDSEFREPATDGQSTQVEGLDVPGGQPLDMQPETEHIVLLDAENPAESDYELIVTLTLEDGTEVAFPAPAREASDEEDAPASQ